MEITVNLEKEELLFRKILLETAKSAYHKEICVYTDFLNINEISIFHSMEKELPLLAYSMYGGYEGAERVRICFHGERIKEHGTIVLQTKEKNEYPIECLRIYPTSEKFARELDHRDYLGAILNVGIERSKLGDILVRGKEAYCYCDALLSEYVKTSLGKVRHNIVRVEVIKPEEVQATTSFKEVTGSVASFRLDSLIALAFRTSRSSITGLIAGEKVFVNARLITSNSFILKPDDIVSVRGFGKFKVKEQGGISKKGRIYATLSIYQ